MENNPAPNNDPVPRGSRRLDRSVVIFLSFYGLFMAGLLVFVFCLGPTYEKFSCSRSTGQCEVIEKYFFGFGRTRRLTFAQESIASARINKTSSITMGHSSPPCVLVLVFKDGSSYPTVDFGFRSWALKKIDEFNRYLKDS